MKGYLFIANSTKPTKEKANSVEPVVIDTFGLAAVNAANELGYKLFYGLNRNCPEKQHCTNFDVTFYDQHTYRDIFAWKDNIQAYKNLCRLLQDHPEIEIIHCNTPIGGVVGRLCGQKYKKKVIYTAHGFHFYKGAPLKNWLFYYPVEKFLAKMTDILITINQEDYEFATKKIKLKKKGKLYFVPGVGIDTKNYINPDTDSRQRKREELGLASDDIALISMGDIVERKNYKLSIMAIADAQNKRLHYFICGEGPEKEKLRSLTVELGIEGQIHFLGFRRDIKELLFASDVFLFTSLQEGLPRSTMEAMAAGLPCVVSAIRGNVDLIKNGEGGFVCEVDDVKGFAEKIVSLAEDKKLRIKMGQKNLDNIKEYDIENVKVVVKEIFDKELGHA